MGKDIENSLITSWGERFFKIFLEEFMTAWSLSREIDFQNLPFGIALKDPILKRIAASFGSASTVSLGEGLEHYKGNDGPFELLLVNFEPFHARKSNKKRLEKIADQASKLIREDGFIVFILKDSATLSQGGLTEIIEKSGLEKNAIIRSPHSFWKESMEPMVLLLVSKNKMSGDFVASFNTCLDRKYEEYASNAAEVFSNFFICTRDGHGIKQSLPSTLATPEGLYDSPDLEKGCLLTKNSFLGFNELSAQQELMELVGNKGLRKYSLRELCLEINWPPKRKKNIEFDTAKLFYDHESGKHVYFSRHPLFHRYGLGRRSKEAPHFEWKSDVAFVQLLIDTKIASADYLQLYLDGPIGNAALELSYSELQFELRKKEIPKERLEDLSIFLPDLGTQKIIASRIKKFRSLTEGLNAEIENALLNRGSDVFNLEIEEGAVKALENKNVHNLLREIEEGETLTVEFKQTYNFNTETKQKFGKKDTGTRDAAAKAIAGLLNKDGGRLFIGIHDDGQILGIEEELQTTVEGSRDKFERGFLDYLEAKLGIIAVTKIQPNFINLGPENRLIFVVNVEMGSEPTYFDGKELFVRTGPQTKSIWGNDLEYFIQERFRQPENPG